MSIRIATIDDVSSICRLVTSLSHFYLHEDTVELPYWFAKTLREEAFKQRIENSDYLNAVYTVDHKVVAYISLQGAQHLYHLFVAEQYQGRGISRLLWQYLIDITASDYYTLRSSLYAVPVYKRFGFVESGDVGEKEGIGFQPMELCL